MPPQIIIIIIQNPVRPQSIYKSFSEVSELPNLQHALTIMFSSLHRLFKLVTVSEERTLDTPTPGYQQIKWPDYNKPPYIPQHFPTV